MKLIIDVDKEEYDILMLWKDNPIGLSWAQQRIIEGTPLPTGRWIDKSPIHWECSECGYTVQRYNNTDYCPNCGARMFELPESEGIE